MANLLSTTITGNLTVDTNILYVDSTNNRVGIGTTSPSNDILHVAGNIMMDGSILRMGSSTTKLVLQNVGGSWNSLSAKGINIGDWNSDPSYGDILVGNYDFSIKNDALTSLLRVKNNGNVLIGTTIDSGYKLDVGGGDFYAVGTNRDWGGIGGLGTHIGTGNFDIYSGNPGSGTHILRVTNGGNLGIGTSSPAYKLDVVGELRATSVLRANSNAIVGGYLDLTGDFFHRDDIKALNKAANNWLIWAQRNTAASEVVIDLNYIGNILPGSDSTYNIGSSSVRFANGYFDTLYGNGSNLTNISSAATLTTARTFTIGSSSKSFNGSANVSWTLNEIQADYRVPNNTLRNNLGDPTTREAALFHGQFNNKFRFLAPTLQEESTDGVNWSTSTRATAAQLGDLMIGEGQGTSFSAIPTGTVGTYGGYRLTWDVVGSTGYVFLNEVYIYNSTSGNTINVTIEKYHNTNGWQVVCGPLPGNNWPGHFYIPHSGITYSNNTSQHSKVRITFESTHSSNTNQFSLYAIEWFGGYPQGRRNPEYYDRDKNVTFPAKISALGTVNVGTGGSGSLELNGVSVLSRSSTYTQLKNPEGAITLYLGDSADRTNYYDNNTHIFRNFGGGSSYAVINSSGNVGIGTSSPSQKLHVVGNIYNTGFAYGDSHSAFTEFRIRNNENNVLRRNGSTLQLNSTDDLVFSNTASFVEAMRINSSGNVLIGTTTDNGYVLNVNGDATINGVRVGLGGGSIAQNTIVGYGALTSTTTGNYNTALGYQAGYSNTSGERNTAVGRQALRANSTGSYNVALGMNALDSNTASNNTALGYQAGYSNTTGSIVAIGYLAGFSNTTGSLTTAIGFQALKNNTTSSSNTAVGLNSLVNTTGNSNTAIGTYAGDANTTGSNNIFIGKDSDGVSATDSNRTFIGNSSTTSTWVGGNLLVGTTTDSGYKLRVDGSALFTNWVRVNGDDGIYFQDRGGGWRMTDTTWLRSYNDKSIYTGGGAYFGSSVGIGTTAPFHALDIYSNSNVPLRVHRPSNANLDSSGAWGIGFSTRGDAATSTTDTRAGIFSYYNGNLFLAAANTSIIADPDAYARLTILNNGYVGIGNTSPDTHLHINGTGTTASSNQYHLIVGDDNTYGINNGGGIIFRGDYNSSGAQANFGAIRAGKVNANDGNANAYLSLLYGASGVLTEGLRVDYNGNVGIGTTSPTSSKLNINSNGSSDSVVRIDAADARGASRYALQIIDSDTNSRGSLYISTSSGPSAIITGGNVLIGTTTDGGYKLDVNGTATFRDDVDMRTNYIDFKSNGSSTVPQFLGHRSSTDLDSRDWTNEGGWAYTTFDANSGNAPNSGSGLHNANGLLSFNTHNGDYGHQIAMTTNTNKLHFRTRNAGAWQSWQEITTNSKDFIPAADSTYDIGSNLVRFANGYFDTLYGDGSNLTGITATETDTLATVTGRGASTSTSLTLSGTLNLTNTSKAIQLGPTSDNNSIYYVDCGNQIHIRANQSGTDNTYTNLMLMSGTGSQTASVGVIGRGNDSRIYWTTSNATKMQLFSTGNLGIGVSSDNGKRLQVGGDVFIKGSASTSSTKIFEVQNSNGTSIMDFRGDAYAFFGCGQGGGAASGFIFRYNDTSHVQFTGYNYGNGSGSYKPILLDTDLVGRGQGIYVNFGGTGYANPAPLSTTEFAVRGRTSDASENVMELRDSNNTEKFVVKNDGSIVTDGSQGWTGTVGIPNNPPGTQNLEFKNGILVNVF